MTMPTTEPTSGSSAEEPAPVATIAPASAAIERAVAAAEPPQLPDLLSTGGSNRITDRSADQLPARLPVEWQDWIASSILQGLEDQVIVGRMLDAGFDPVFSRSALIVVRSMTERVQREAPESLQEYESDPMRLSLSNKSRVADREVRLGFVLHNPNLALLVDLLSADECDKLIALSAGKLRRSEVVDRHSGHIEISKVRTSEGTYFNRGENAVVERLERRLAAITGVPVDHGEPLQILHYRTGGEYLPHHDFFDPADPGSAAHLALGGQRFASIVIYLNDVHEGGATDFPTLELSVKAQRGSAIYFDYCNGRGQLDTRCLHAGMPVGKGEKWIATKWLRQRPYVR